MHFRAYLLDVRYSHFSAQKHVTIRQNIGDGPLAMLFPTKLLGEHVPARDFGAYGELL